MIADIVLYSFVAGGCALVGAWAERRINNKQHEQYRHIMKTQAELTAIMQQQAAQITALSEVAIKVVEAVGKIGTETDGLKASIEELKKQIENQDNVSPELEAAADSVTAAFGTLSNAVTAAKTRADEVDDKVPDAPPTT